jgi:hypothetical protein
MVFQQRYRAIQDAGAAGRIHVGNVATSQQHFRADIRLFSTIAEGYSPDDLSPLPGLYP